MLDYLAGVFIFNCPSTEHALRDFAFYIVFSHGNPAFLLTNNLYLHLQQTIRILSMLGFPPTYSQLPDQIRLHAADLSAKL